jgi:branched-chain amino acid transport system substrate-binding protein
MKRSLTALLGAALLALAAPAGAAPATGTPYEIAVILPTTGSGAFLGTHEIAALGVLEKSANDHGGINGVPLKFVYQDDQTSPPLTVQLTQAAIAKHVPVIIGSALAATCSAMAAIVERNGPVQYCLSPILRGAAGGYSFSASAGSADIAAVIARFYKAHGWTKLALITSTDASGSDFEKQFDLVMAQSENRSLTLVDREHFGGADLSVAAQMARIKSAAPQALVTFATGTPLGTLLHGYHDAGLDIPVTASGGNMIYEQMAQYAAFAPSKLYFAATRGIAPDANLRPGPIMDAQNVYFKAFKAAGIRPDFATSLAWDPGSILIEGLRKLGPSATAEQLHGFIQGLHSWAGIDGIYDFRDGSQRGIGQNALVVYHWENATSAFAVVSRAAGNLKENGRP